MAPKKDPLDFKNKITSLMDGTQSILTGLLQHALCIVKNVGYISLGQTMTPSLEWPHFWSLSKLNLHNIVFDSEFKWGLYFVDITFAEFGKSCK